MDGDALAGLQGGRQWNTATLPMKTGRQGRPVRGSAVLRDHPLAASSFGGIFRLRIMVMTRIENTTPSETGTGIL